MYKFQRKRWQERMLQMEKRLLIHYGVPQVVVNTADGSFLMRAFLKGWQCRDRRG
jgi:hypothetical protein